MTSIAISNIVIAICDNTKNMKLGEKIRYLREVEGSIRGLDREMTQQEIVRALKKELGASISQSYLSQIEKGERNGTVETCRVPVNRRK